MTLVQNTIKYNKRSIQKTGLCTTVHLTTVHLEHLQEGRSVGTCYLHTSWDLINPGWVAWVRVYDVERPEKPNDPRFNH